MIIMFLFACMLISLNSRFTDTVMLSTTQDMHIHLQSSRGNPAMANRPPPTQRVHQAKAQSTATTSRTVDSPTNEHEHRLAGLNCDKWGGPSNEAAEEMVYWEDIPSDSHHVSPFRKPGISQYMTFEPDSGGWNNIRMAMETLLATAFAMGRTLVLPPHQVMYLLHKKDNNQRNAFSFDHFFHMESISQEHKGLDIISMQEFLELFLDGRFEDPVTGDPLFPPGNRTDWNDCRPQDLNTLKTWLRESSRVLNWDNDECLAAFPRSNSDKDMEELINVHEEIKKEGYPSYEDFVGIPFPVNASVKDRMRENWADRHGLCLYDKELQDTPWIHFPVGHSGKYKSRMLVHFYAFLFFADWKTDLWTKRFVRDHIRYVDEIQCAAARVIAAIRTRAKEKSVHGDFDTLHVRRGDFQFKPTRVPVWVVYNKTKDHIPEGSTLYVATDEKDKDWFNLMKEHYDVVFLDDFMHELQGVNTNYYGMIDQLISSRGRVFYGCWFSTFTGYINRLRGYHADDHQAPGYEMGIVPSYYYAVDDRYLHMQEYYPVKKQFYAREFPTSWRLIDTGLEDTQTTG